MVSIRVFNRARALRNHQGSRIRFCCRTKLPYQETDDLDPHAWHLSALVNGELAAYARVVEAGIKNVSLPSVA